jgi:hypothetical protein
MPIAQSTTLERVDRAIGMPALRPSAKRAAFRNLLLPT